MPDPRLLSDRFTLRWDAEMGCYRVSVPNLEGPIEVVPAADYDALWDLHQRAALDHYVRRAERAEATVKRLRAGIKELQRTFERRRLLHTSDFTRISLALDETQPEED